MTIDLTGGIDPRRELVFADRPDDPEMRDSVSMWVSDDRGAVGLTRIGVEAVSANWDHHGLQVNLAFPDGRVFRLRADGASWPAAGPDGRPTVLGAGPLAFRCVEPFQRWTMSFDGSATETSTFDLAAGRKDGPSVDVRFEVEATMAVPPWEQGRLVAEAGAVLTAHEVDLMGGDRYEQLFRCTGSVEVSGGPAHSFQGSGLRIRRQGIRRLSDFRGHFWPSALFPSGKAFGALTYPPRADGLPTFNEGFVFDGDGELIPATVTEAAWLSKIVPLGEDVSFVLDTPRGPVHIEGTTVLSTYDIHHADKTFSTELLHEEHRDFPAVQQCGVRYRWDGEETYGMLERSSPVSKITMDPA
jgi:hypothetical protein